MKNKLMLTAVLMVALIGTLVIINTQAATSSISIEAESGTKLNVKVAADETASNGQAIQFGTSVGKVLPMKTNFPAAFAFQDGTPVKINGTNIRNVGSYSASTLCGRIDWSEISARGFNTVRLAVDWPSIEPTKGTLSTTGLSKLDDAVNTAKRAGLYVILDPIHLKGVNGNLPNWVTGDNSIQKIQNHATFYLTEIAKKYKNDDNVIGIDLVNEPHPNPLPFDQNANLLMFNSLINTVRKVDTDKILMIEPQTGDSSWDNVNWNIIENKHNLVVSHHTYYAGGNNNGGYSSSGWTAGDFVYNGTSGYTNPNRVQIEAHFDKILSWLNPQSLPLYIGEYGIGRNTTNRNLWIEHNVTAMNNRDIPRTWWDGCTSEGNMSLHTNTADPKTDTWDPITNTLKQW